MRARPVVVAALLLLAVPALSVSVAAASPPKPFIPDLFDPRHRFPKPNLDTIKAIRFLTTDDFPPFHFALPDGTLTGFDIDLARAICADLKLECTIQARRFDTLIEQIKSGNDDALIAAIANTSASRADLAFTAPYYTTPGRFVVAVETEAPKPSSAQPAKPQSAESPSDKRPAVKEKVAAPASVTPEALAGRIVGVEAGTAHEAYLYAFFPKAVLKTFPDQATLHAALRDGTVAAIFGDGIGLALWLNGTDARGCCAFRGGPFTESRFFGNGVSIAVGKTNDALRQVLDYELAKLAAEGTYADLYLKYFPIGFY